MEDHAWTARIGHRDNRRDAAHRRCPHRVLAAIIDNNVDIEWSQVGGDACGMFGLCVTEVTIIGAPRLVEDASHAGDNVFFDIAVLGPQLFNGMDLHLNVGDTSFEELTDANGDPLVLDLLLNGPLAFAAFFRPGRQWRGDAADHPR